MQKTLKLNISGRVQGVWFRATTKDVVDDFNIKRENKVTGYVKNLSDGSVEVLLQGDKEYLLQLKELIIVGPPASRVDMVNEEWGESNQNYSNFNIGG